MSEAHANDDLQPFIEEHQKPFKASVLFTPPVLELFKGLQDREHLVAALGAEIKRIPTDYIPYGSFDFRQLHFVYRAGWAEEEDKWFIHLDLAAGMIEIGEIYDPETTDEEPSDHEAEGEQTTLQ